MNAATVPSGALPDIAELTKKLGAPDATFDAWRDSVPDKHWVKLDLSALRIGYELGRSIQPAQAAQPSLHPATADLVRRFSVALAEKLAAAEQKYGYSDNWARPDWMDECRQHLLDHIAKGDARDVAAYCAFLWHHGERTAPAQPVGVPDGWAMVPREPTETMIEAADDTDSPGGDPCATPDYAVAYSAMLAASPQPPAQPSADAEDAARYRHVRKHFEVSAARHGYNDLLFIRPPGNASTQSAEIMDSVIDAASAAEGVSNV